MARVYVEPLEWDEALRLKEVTLNHYHKTGEWGPYMLILNGFHSAFRRQDLLAFTWGTYVIGLDKGRYVGKISVVESKTGKHREVPMSDEYLKSVLFMMSKLKRPKGEFVHKSAYASALNPVINVETCNRWIKKFAKKAGISQNVTSHTLRKTWALRAYNLLDRTEDALQKISVALNHNTMLDTRTYIGLSRNSDAINELYK